MSIETNDLKKYKLVWIFKFQGRVIGTGIWRIFWNPSYGHSWTIPKTISEINTSFSSLTTSFLSI
jgi:hypothetical protein